MECSPTKVSRHNQYAMTGRSPHQLWNALLRGQVFYTRAKLSVAVPINYGMLSYY